MIDLYVARKKQRSLEAKWQSNGIWKSDLMAFMYRFGSFVLRQESVFSCALCTRPRVNQKHSYKYPATEFSSQRPICSLCLEGNAEHCAWKLLDLPLAWHWVTASIRDSGVCVCVNIFLLRNNGENKHRYVFSKKLTILFMSAKCLDILLVQNLGTPGPGFPRIRPFPLVATQSLPQSPASERLLLVCSE